MSFSQRINEALFAAGMSGSGTQRRFVVVQQSARNWPEVSSAQNNMAALLALAERTKRETGGYFEIRRADGNRTGRTSNREKATNSE